VVYLTGIGTMQIVGECRMRAAILTAIAKDAPEMKSQLLYLAQEWLIAATLREQFIARTDWSPAPTLH